MAILKFRQCNCCKLNEVCQADRITLRAAKRIPGCIPPEPQKTFCEENNIDINVTDVAEKIYEFRDRLDKGGFTPDGIGWVPAITSESERRRLYINYGLIRPKA